MLSPCIGRKKAMFLIKPSPTFHETVATIKTFDLPNKQSQYHFMPDNHIDLTMNLGSPIKRSLIGSIRQITIETNEMIISSCRSKGMTLAGENIQMICAKIPAQFTGLFFSPGSCAERDQLIRFGRFPEIKNSDDFENHIKSWWQKLPHFEPDFILEEAIEMMKASNGKIKVKDVNDQLGISKSSLEQKFNREIGLTPKEFCKIEKLSHFLHSYIEHKDSLNLTQMTFLSGYYDQSHLIKEFRYFMDIQPKEFVQMAGLTF